MKAKEKRAIEREKARAPAGSDNASRVDHILNIKAGIRALGLEGSSLIYPEPKQVQFYVSAIAALAKSHGAPNCFLAPVVSHPAWWSDEERTRIGIDSKGSSLVSGEGLLDHLSEEFLSLKSRLDAKKSFFFGH